jgi:hypothetical protein
MWYQRLFQCPKHRGRRHFLLKLRVTWSVSLIHFSVELWRARKPNWLALSRPLSSICFWTNFSITFSNSLPVVGRSLIGRKFWGKFGSLPGFGKVIIFAFFQGFEKFDSRRQWLNKWVKCTNGRFGRCLRHAFEMPSFHRPFSISTILLISLYHRFLSFEGGLVYGF